MVDMVNKVDSLIGRIFEVTGISSQTELADALCINRSGITHARRKNVIPDRWIVKLYRRFGLNPVWIESGTGTVFLNGDPGKNVEFKTIPKVKARLSAGTGSFETLSDVTDYLYFQSKWLSRKGSANAMVAMEVFGNSMEPELRAGDTVLIDQSQTEILAGAIYALGVEDTILVKRLEKHPNKLVLTSENRDYQPIFLSLDEIDKVRIIGKVVWSCREYR